MVPGAGPAPAAARPLRGPFRAARRGLLRRPCRGKAAPHAGGVRGARDRRRRKRRKPRGERPESGPGGGAAVLGPADGGAEPGCGTADRGAAAARPTPGGTAPAGGSPSPPKDWDRSPTARGPLMRYRTRFERGVFCFAL